jgi:hypothetical protein
VSERRKQVAQRERRGAVIDLRSGWICNCMVWTEEDDACYREAMVAVGLMGAEIFLPTAASKQRHTYTYTYIQFFFQMFLFDAPNDDFSKCYAVRF